MSVIGERQDNNGMVEILQAKKAGYDLDKGGFQRCDKFRTIAGYQHLWAFSWRPKNCSSKFLYPPGWLKIHQKSMISFLSPINATEK
jgi:hypothetical protein